MYAIFHRTCNDFVVFDLHGCDTVGCLVQDLNGHAVLRPICEKMVIEDILAIPKTNGSIVATASQDTCI